MQPLATWLTCVCRPTPCVVGSNCIPQRLGLCWSRAPGLLLVSAASPSMDHEHGTVCQPILEHQIRLCVPSSVISRPTCFTSSLHCCWLVCSAPFLRRRCDCLASSAPFINIIQTYLLTYLLTSISHDDSAPLLLVSFLFPFLWHWETKLESLSNCANHGVTC